MEKASQRDAASGACARSGQAAWMKTATMARNTRGRNVGASIRSDAGTPMPARTTVAVAGAASPARNVSAREPDAATTEASAAARVIGPSTNRP